MFCYKTLIGQVKACSIQNSLTSFFLVLQCTGLWRVELIFVSRISSTLLSNHVIRPICTLFSCLLLAIIWYCWWCLEWGVNIKFQWQWRLFGLVQYSFISGTSLFAIQVPKASIEATRRQAVYEFRDWRMLCLRSCLLSSLSSPQ